MKETIAPVIVEKYEGLIRKVTYRCGVHSHHPNFEDYLQEARWQLVLLAVDYTDIQSFEEAFPLSYLYKKLYWSLIDFQRKQKECENLVDLAKEGLEVPAKLEALNELEIQAAFQEFYTQLDEKDQERLTALLGGRPLSRQMKSYYRQILREKFKLFFQSF